MNPKGKTDIATIWQAVCSGANTAGLVAEKVGISRGHASMYLRMMAEVGLLNRTTDHQPVIVEGDPRRHTTTATVYLYAPDYDAADRLGW